VRNLRITKPGVTLGRQEMAVRSQALYFDPCHPADSPFVESVMWREGKIALVPLNVPGGSNDDLSGWSGIFADPTALIQVGVLSWLWIQWLESTNAM